MSFSSSKNAFSSHDHVAWSSPLKDKLAHSCYKMVISQQKFPAGDHPSKLFDSDKMMDNTSCTLTLTINTCWGHSSVFPYICNGQGRILFWVLDGCETEELSKIMTSTISVLQSPPTFFFLHCLPEWSGQMATLLRTGVKSSASCALRAEVLGSLPALLLWA